MALGYLLLLLVPIAAIAYVLWDHQRKTAERNAAAEGRLQDLLAVAKPVARTAQDGGAKPAVMPGASAPPAAGGLVPAAHAALYAVRGRMLDPPQTLLYLLLKTALPDYTVLPRVSLAVVLEAGPGFTGLARDEQTRQLASLTVDFVIADRSMRPVVVIDLTPAENDAFAQADRHATRSRIAAAGMRYLALDPKRLPRRDAVRAVVLGEAPISA